MKKQIQKSMKRKITTLALFLLLIFPLVSIGMVGAADTTPPVVSVYLGQDDNTEHNSVSYDRTITANLWNAEGQTSVVECEINWNEGDGWEDVEVHNDSQSKRLEALQMGANILHYVFNGEN